MTTRHDVESFDQRSAGYERGRRGGWHLEIAQRTAQLALAAVPVPRRVLDLGCGTGLVLRSLASQLSSTAELVGIDPAPGMLDAARAAVGGDARFDFTSGFAEELPFADDHFELVVSATSFDHWRDQQRGLSECRRVLTGEGRLVLTDLCSLLLLPTLLFSGRSRARTVRRAARLLTVAGFGDLAWHSTYGGGLIKTVVCAPAAQPR